MQFKTVDYFDCLTVSTVDIYKEKSLENDKYFIHNILHFEKGFQIFICFSFPYDIIIRS